ncbi:hypothetical protein ABIC09_007394 [Bradyrhizobium sp. S3.12.5]|uniref:hypothetical protein n=1 Tax=Bradyrhizobium sp. S3.12.5 TaxID=3156386 RepID=UPI003394CA68
MRSYAETLACLQAADRPVRELRGSGCAAVTPEGARLIALAFDERAENLLWTHPLLCDREAMKDAQALAGGMGGDRLWFAPEVKFHWRGRSDWLTFTNYAVPLEADPGNYRFSDRDVGQIGLSAAPTLPTTDGSPPVKFFVRRTFCLARPPLFPNGRRLLGSLSYVGVEARHELHFDSGQTAGVVGLWHLLQAPVESVAIIPTKRDWNGAPLSYGNPGDWCTGPDQVSWRYGGIAKAKLGLEVSAVTGRVGIVRQLSDGQWALIVRDFPVSRDGSYVDHPYGQARRDQVVQAWDGFGFGELEYHGVGLDAGDGPRSLSETDTIWAFGGSADSIAAVGAALLGVSIAAHLSGT